MAFAQLGADGKPLDGYAQLNFGHRLDRYLDPPAEFGYAPSAAGWFSLLRKISFL